ncbi:unnamed protein product [Mytilus coruscus]|uniref:Uncharacterized protein n=1 Tax=Mytilus coruscus TaxID=42192 RepID=A0A6J8E6W4_MYTCO|nr:unnamed protein product [Mytilus coruscus]
MLGIISSSKADDNLNWKVVKKILQFGEDLHLFCQVEDCCRKSAGWGKWTPNNKLSTIFIDVKILQKDEISKYYGGTSERGFFLVIRNMTSDDLNIAYSCTYGFQISKKKILLKTDVFIEKTEIDPDGTIKDGTPEKEKPILFDLNFRLGIAACVVTVCMIAFFVVKQCIAAYHKRKLCKSDDTGTLFSNARTDSGYEPVSEQCPKANNESCVHMVNVRLCKKKRIDSLDKQE